MSIFNFIKSRVSITQVISDYTSLKKIGFYLKGSCPFHHEKTASFTVTPHKDIFYCFGCHQGGDVIAFIARAENCSQLEAARYIAERYGIELPQEVVWEKSEQHMEEKKRYNQLLEIVADWCSQNLAVNPEAQQYLTSRNITKETVRLFSIGYFSNHKMAIKHLLTMVQKEGFLAQDLCAAHVILEGKHGLYSPFEDRIMFPIKDHLGAICGFGGRTFRPQDARPKYYNSHDHQFFNKGSVLYGFDQAKKQIQTHNKVFLVEGYIDCIAMAQAGYPYTVATLGTACTVEHLKIIARHTQQLFAVFDGDNAGKKAIIRLSELCFDMDMELAIVTLPSQDDPASYLQKGGDFNLLVQQARDIFTCYIDQLEIDFSSQRIAGKIQAIKELLVIIGRINDPLRRDLLLQKIAATCSIPVNTLQKELVLLAKPVLPKGAAPSTSQAPEDDKKYLKRENFELEKQVFCAIINNHEYLLERDESLLVSILPQPLAKIVVALQDYRKQAAQASVDFSGFFITLTDKEQELVSRLLIKQATVANKQEFLGLMDQLEKKQWKIKVNDVKIRLAQAQQTNNTELVQTLVAEFQSLKQKMLQKGSHDN